MNKRKTTYKLYRSEKAKNKYHIIDVSARSSMEIIKVSNDKKKKIAKKIFDDHYYQEIENNVKLLMELTMEDIK